MFFLEHSVYLNHCMYFVCIMGGQMMTVSLLAACHDFTFDNICSYYYLHTVKKFCSRIIVVVSKTVMTYFLT